MAAPTAAADTAAPPPPPPSAPETAATVSLAPPDMAAPTAAAPAPAPPVIAPPPPAPAPPVIAPPSPPPAPEPAATVSHTPPHVPVPAPAADTAARPPLPPPAPELATKVSHTFPPAPPQPDAPAPKKRKPEEAGFHTSSYYKIRATVADLRLRFVQVYEATDFRNSEAAREILKEIKTVMELSKKMRLGLGAASELSKPSEKPLAATVKDGPTEPIPSGERNQFPQTGPTAISPNNANDGVPTTQA